MRVRRIHYSNKEIEALKGIFIEKAIQNKGNWKDVFGNENPIHLEIGTGKGQFLTTLAKNNPNINYIAMEKLDLVLALCAKKIKDQGLENIIVMNEDAQKLEEIFENGEIDRVYLNFSDPWPKNRHAKRRLTHSRFLIRYENILKTDGEIHFKTDNLNLFEFSLNHILEYGYNLKNISLDLHRDEEESANIVTTEYEDKFKAKNMKIYRLEAYKK